MTRLLAMESLLISVFMCLLLMNGQVVAQFSCDPYTDCLNNTAGAYVPDPQDCEKFYVCVTGGNGQLIPSTSPLSCPTGCYFDLNATVCSIETMPGACGPNVCSTSGVCETECPTFNGEIPEVANKKNCSTYFVCLEGGPVEVPCPSDTPYYDGNTCRADISKCCDFCTAQCINAGTEIADPCDCTAYYVCVNPGKPSNDFRFQCSPGTYFDEEKVDCLSGSCTSLCTDLQCGSNVTATTKATTTSLGTSDCTSLNSFTCPSSNGNFPRCEYCDPSYFSCTNGVASIGSCKDGEVFVPNENYPYCVPPSNCPFNTI